MGLVGRAFEAYVVTPSVHQLWGKGQIASYLLLVESSTLNNRPNSQGILQMLINLHDSCLVTTSVAVIWRYDYQFSSVFQNLQGSMNIPEKIVTTFLS